MMSSVINVKKKYKAGGSPCYDFFKFYMGSKVTGPVVEHKHFILGVAYKLKLKLKTCPQLQMI